MKKIFFIIIMLLIPVINYNQSDSLQSLFPLHVGNIWQYKISHYITLPPPTISYGKVEVLEDTLINGEIFFKVLSEMGGHAQIWPIYYHNFYDSVTYLSYDSVNNTVIVYSTSFGEGTLFKTDALQNECWEYFGIELCCKEVDTVLFFGDYRLRKIFETNRNIYGPPWWGCEIVEGFGPRKTWVDNSWSVQVIDSSELVYAKINGIEFGSYITSAIEDPYLLNKYLLSQNFPNPFNPTTKITYQTTQTGFITLKVYDLLGREVATLVNEEKPAGSYEVEFDGGNLSSGIYFYQLKAGDPSTSLPAGEAGSGQGYTETKKMIIMK